MLLRLKLEDFFLIKGQELEFCRGLNVITGETGTGKSLTASSILFLMGQEGEYPEGTSVEVELLFQGEQTVLRREVQKGRSRYYINGRGSTKKAVEELLSSCVLLQGQNDRTKIVRADFQREVYDRFAQALEIRKQVELAYQERSELLQKITALRERAREREIRKRLLQEEIAEVERVGLSPQEHQRLKERLAEISLAEKINHLLGELTASAEAAQEHLSRTLKALRELSSYTDLKGY
ncbi:MAG: AAA family ATPase, partial [Aquificaceae bacterium]|nr:AAA family ATPase [Aquificaceae bacterium]